MITATRPWEERDERMLLVVFALMGGFYWAIRGSAGFGGGQGALMAGTGWALLWIWASHLGTVRSTRPYASPWAVVAIMLGTMLGGMTGYGVYTAWVDGRFLVHDSAAPQAISPLWGYAMLLVCGLHWGGNLGALLSWCAPERRADALAWLLRLGLGIGGGALAWALVRGAPHLFLPLYTPELYSDPANKTCLRAVGAVETIAIHLGVFLGFLTAALLRRDRRAVKLMLTVSLGFALPFCIGGYWHTLRDSALQLDWWKNWEMGIGLGGGLSLGLAFLWFNQPGAVPPAPLGPIATRFFGWGIPVWWGLQNVLDNGVKGWCDIHQMPLNNSVWTVLLLGSAGLMLVKWRGTRLLGLSTQTSDSIELPCLTLQGAIVLAGLAVSWPVTFATGNYFLLTAYSIYLGVSTYCAWQLRQRL